MRGKLKDLALHPTEAADKFAGLIAPIDELIAQVTSLEQRWSEKIGDVHPAYRASATNLVHYLALRQMDLRELQEQLARLGLSSLGRMEGHVMATLDAVRCVLARIAGQPEPETVEIPVDFDESMRTLAANSDAIFGPSPADRAVRIMVTLSSEAASDYELVRDLVQAGMDCARINCAHDDIAMWERMIDNIHRASVESDRPCRILMDLAGVKPRTGPLECGPEVVKLRPTKDRLGEVIAPVRVWLAKDGLSQPDGLTIDASLPVDEMIDIPKGSTLRLRDARRKKRKLKVVQSLPDGILAEVYETTYVTSGARLKLSKKDERALNIGRLPATEIPIVLDRGDRLMLLREPVVGRDAVRDDCGVTISPAVVSCTLPEVVAGVKEGETVKFDDGRIEGVVRSINEDGLEVEITRTAIGGRKLRSGKSINFPDSALYVNGLTEKDLSDLDFVASKADSVGLSFVNSGRDVTRLQAELQQRNAEGTGVILKVETKRGFQQLPLLLLAAMRTYPVGVMIARGDLAVECGWERTAEVQEEILWLCEAAHVPVIWATQVLESLAKRGMPSRAEITDAAMAERAECVMLNKGPYIIDAIRTLEDVLRRMQAHQAKKTSLLRSLKVSELGVATN